MGILNLNDVPPPFDTGDVVDKKTVDASNNPGSQVQSSTPVPPATTVPPTSSVFDTSALTDAEPAATPAAPTSEPSPPFDVDPVKTLELKPKIVDQLVTVFDPEIPVNIYELGLIYDIDVNADGLVGVRMTLTSPGCPAAQSLPIEVKAKAKAVPGVSDAWVDVVWEPPWEMSKMTDAAKLQLGLL